MWYLFESITTWSIRLLVTKHKQTVKFTIHAVAQVYALIPVTYQCLPDNVKMNSVCLTATCLENFMVISRIFGNVKLWVCRCIRRSPSFLNVLTIKRTLNNKVVGIFSVVYIMEYLKTNSRSVFVIWINESQGFRKRTVRYPHKRNCI